jgi:hypothetical protein
MMLGQGVNSLVATPRASMTILYRLARPEGLLPVASGHKKVTLYVLF